MRWIEYKGFEPDQFRFSAWVWCLIALYLLIPFIFYMFLPSFTARYRTRLNINDSQAVVCVLGDLAHSPRMMYHTKSLTTHGYNVQLCGYVESVLPDEIADNDDIEIYDIQVIRNTYKLPYIIFGLLKVFHQFCSLSVLLFEVMQNSRFVILQNPPSIPLLLIVVMLKKLWYKNCTVVVDWHNLNYSILNLKFKNLNHPVVKFIKLYEERLGRLADLNITVTKEMARFLNQEFGIAKAKLITLYDKAPSKFQPITDPSVKTQIINSNPDIFNTMYKSNPTFKFDPTNTKILISSTSFTEDEDFGILIEALKIYDQYEATKTDQLPNILLIVTGKGPLKSRFLASVEAANFNKIAVQCVWVSSEFYPQLVSVADLGVSLHTSSSGIDLPMKIVDLFGCGVPVITVDFKAISELVHDGINGAIVRNSHEMGQTLVRLFQYDDELQVLQKGAMAETKNRWQENWDATLGPLIDSPHR